MGHRSYTDLLPKAPNIYHIVEKGEEILSLKVRVAGEHSGTDLECYAGAAYGVYTDFLPRAPNISHKDNTNLECYADAGARCGTYTDYLPRAPNICHGDDTHLECSANTGMRYLSYTDLLPRAPNICDVVEGTKQTARMPKQIMEIRLPANSQEEEMRYFTKYGRPIRRDD